jgi:hypothetical protein
VDHLFNTLRRKVADSDCFVAAQRNNFIVEKETVLNGFGMSGVDAGLKFKSVLILVDFPDFDNAF